MDAPTMKYLRETQVTLTEKNGQQSRCSLLELGRLLSVVMGSGAVRTLPNPPGDVERAASPDIARTGSQAA